MRNWEYPRSRWLPREKLEAFVDVVRQARNHLSQEFNREFEAFSVEDHRRAGHIASRIYLLNRVMPVHPKDIR